MSQHDLCGPSGETLERARELLHTVTVKTAPGTGFQLKDPAGRPAACALIASEQLKNTVVNPTSAQGSSFRAALAHDISHTHTHKPDAHAPPERRDTRSGLSGTSQVSYDSLVAKHALSRDYADCVARWCQRAEFTYFNLGKGNNIVRASPKIKLGIFFWVCKVLEWDAPDPLLAKSSQLHGYRTIQATKNGLNFLGAGLSKATTSCAGLGGLRP
ncbi:hypothetical protein F5878DRAFT_728958 [Lentinula raphanica]|uniref:Uncharacterized protein n=1 Tax=Lentinula raphanica TaxID=153919 RepID=A0AA38NYY4_9AGAR|nr:hypothetical protein F5878DRAFT_728958 [Lentinula raphanica]